MRLVDRHGGTNHSFPVSNGLLSPQHHKRIGPAIWLFLWYVDHTTGEKDGVGLVHGGKPIPDLEPAKALGIDRATVARWRRRLHRDEYVQVKRTGQGYAICVVNSKKWAWRRNGRREKCSSARQAFEKCSSAQHIGKSAQEMFSVVASRSDIHRDSNKDTSADLESEGSSAVAFQGEHLTITHNQDKKLGEAFPCPDRQAEYRKMDCWLDANPTKRKKECYPFAFNWLARAQERNRDSEADPSELKARHVKFRPNGEPYYA